MTTENEDQLADDVYHCPECGYEWGGYDRAPPHPHCPECGETMMRRGPADEGSRGTPGDDNGQYVLKVPKGSRVGMTPELYDFLKEHGRLELFGEVRMPGRGVVSDLEEGQ